MLLVTTAEESSWDGNRKILFVGEWCRLYSRRHIWKSLDSELMPYHWDSRKKYNFDYNYLAKVYEDCLKQLNIELNRINGVSHGINYWRIVIGPWLRFFIDVLFDRFEQIRIAHESGKVGDTWILPYRLNDWTPRGFGDFYASLNSDRWNHVIFAECIRHIGVAYEEKRDEIYIQPETLADYKQSLLRTYSRKALGAFETFIPSRINRHIFISFYLPFVRFSRLQIGLGQLPFTVAPMLLPPDSEVDADKRTSLSLSVGTSRFELLLQKLIPQFVPKVHVENYHYFRKLVLAAYPKKPTTIFTANAYQADDGFKVWAAEKRLNGVPLVIGQHGGNMGIAHHNQTEDHQIKIADSFCSWGWVRPGITSICQMPSLQLSQRVLTSDVTGDILLILASLPRYFYCHFSMPLAGQFLRYLTDQISIVSRVKTSVKALIRIRLNGDGYGWDITERLEEAGLRQMIDNSSDRLEARVSKCRLCIVSYNSTVILQTLQANFPTIAFWDPELFDIRREATPLVSRLREVGILHDTVESVARFIDGIHNDVQNWWRNPELQDVRDEFCKAYAKTSDTWITEWKDHLNDVAAKGCQQ